jgi:uncharacterized protein YjbI with pentapeptide repeats
MFRWIAFGLIAFFPVAVLMVLDVSALRYQSVGTNLAQRGALVIDLSVLVWFFYRQRLAGGGKPNSIIARLRWWVGLLWLPVTLVAMNFAWLNIPGSWLNIPGSGPATERIILSKRSRWGDIIWQPLYRLLCRRDFQWGCPFLTVDHRTLVSRVWKEEAIATLRKIKTDTTEKTDTTDTKAALAAVEGVFLRDRALRFARLDESRLYGADLIGADLSNASLSATNLTGANLAFALLINANLEFADLSGAKLNDANLEDADLTDADLSGANLRGANLTYANLEYADLTGADLSGVHLNNTGLNKTDLTGAKGLSQGQLDLACGFDGKLPPHEPALTILSCGWRGGGGGP